MAGAVLPIKRKFGETMRQDAWWAQPLAVFLGFAAFLVYAHFRILEGAYYYSGHSTHYSAPGQDVRRPGAGDSAEGHRLEAGATPNWDTNYLAPFYSPLLFDVAGLPASGHAFWSKKPDWLGWLPGWVSPAALILIFPAGFRFTCYYYRGAYYKAFWADPPSCAVGEPRKGYLGENSLPLILQNIHRYFLYFAIIFIFILSYDVWLGMWFRTPDGGWRFGIGLGTILMAVNVVLIALYTFGCHSLRHLIGGGRDCVTRAPLGAKVYDCVSCLNRRHMMWAWFSLFSVGFTDFYIRMLAKGAWVDWRIV